jgi:hypothetical protein
VASRAEVAEGPQDGILDGILPDQSHLREDADGICLRIGGGREQRRDAGGGKGRGPVCQPGGDESTSLYGDVWREGGV